MIPPQEFAERRTKFFDFMEKGIALFPSNKESIMSNDVHYPYRQNSDLLYLCNFPEPETILVMVKSEEERKTILFVPPRDPEFEIWNGLREGVDGAIQNYGADEAYSNEELEEKLQELLGGQPVLYYAFGNNPDIDKLILDSKQILRKKRKKFPSIIVDPTPQVHEMRLIKSDKEIEVMKKGAEISMEAHLLAMKATKPGMMEYQIDAIYEYVFKSRGAKRAAYPSIVGSGKNATILHYAQNDAVLRNGDLLLVDAGCEYNNYAIDITRTWPVNGKFNPAQRRIYELVLNVQEACIEKCQPGILFEDLHNFAVRQLTEGLVDLGLLDGEIEKLIGDKTYRRFFMHGLGHSLGIDTHDVPMVPLRERELRKGMVVTIEPGIYIPDQEDIPEEYRGIGIRLEDDILVTDGSPVNLTAKLPKKVKEIEKIVGSLKEPIQVPL